MSWLDRQSFLGAESDKVLAGLTVGVVGLGGGGSHVAQQLAHLGVGNYVLADADVITETNLNRLVGGTRANVAAGTPKIDLAERLILSVNPDANVQKFRQVWQECSEALKTCDVVIGGLDSVRAKHEMDAFTRRFMIPYIDMGMDVHAIGAGNHLIAGQVVLTGPGEPCLQCLGIVTEEGLRAEAARYGDAGGKPQVVWPNGVLASVAVGLFVQLVTPWSDDSVSSAFIEYDGNRNTTKESARLARCRDRGCSHYGFADVGDPLFDFRKVNEAATSVTPVRANHTLPAKTPRGWLRRLFRRSRKF